MPIAAHLNMALRLQGIDATAGAFNSVGARAAQIGRKISGAFKVAAASIAAIGAGAAIKSALNSMTALHDAAQQAGTSSAFPQKFTGAMAQAGVALDQAAIASSIQRLNAALVSTKKIKAFEALGIEVKNLQGLKPEQALFGFLETLSKIPDEQTRLLALQRAMGDSGLRLAPLLRLGPDSLKQSLADVMAMIPAASEKGVNLATDINNAFSLLASHLQTDFFNALSSILSGGTETFGSLDLALLSLYERAKYGAKNIAALFSALWQTLTSGFQAFLESFSSGLSFIFAKIVNLNDRLHAYAAQAIGSIFYDWGENERAAVDSALQDRIDSRNAAAAQKVASSFFGQTLSESISKNATEYASRIDALQKGLKAKSTLTALTPSSITPLQDAITSAVSTGVKDGLAEGIQSGSYSIIKNAFKARTRLLTSPASSPAAAALASAASAATPTQPILPPAQSRSPTQDALQDIIALLKKLFDSSTLSNKHLASLGSF